jgi:hypothetical protein
MSFDDYQYYHGAALCVIAEHDAFTSINKFPDIESRATYLLNHNTALFVKHTTVEGLKWKFTFSPEHQDIIRRLFDRMGERTYILLVCNEWVCMLNYGEYATCLDENHQDSEWLEVWRPEGGRYRVRGAQGDLPNLVPMNRFPDILFD